MLTQEELKEAIIYFPESGRFRWKKPGHGRRFFEDIGTLGEEGYRYIRIGQVLYKTAQLAFLYMKGYVPYKIDHWDTVRSNDIFENLRECTSSQNSANSSIRSDNSTGYKGVSRSNSIKHYKKPYRAQICVNGKQIYLGRYETPGMAHLVYERAAIKYFGEFARV